jgi:hypothetical protein
MASVDSSLQRFDAALARLEAAVETLFAQSGHPVLLKKQLDVMMADRAQLAEQLDQSLARERELQSLADEASAALGTAIDEVRAALGRPDQKEEKDG